MLLHEFRHIQPDQALRGVEQVLRQLLDQFRLTHAGAAHEDKAHRLMFGGDAHPVAAYGGGDGVNRRVLTDELFPQTLVQLAQAFELLLPDLAGGNLGPQLNDPRQIVHRQLRLAPLSQPIQFGLQLQLLALDLRQAGEIRFLHGLQQLPLLGVVRQLPADLLAAVDTRVLQVHIGARLVDEVDSLVRQEAVGNIPLAEQHGLPQNSLRNLHAVEGLIVVGDTPEDFHGILHIRLVHRHRLEPPLQGGVLLNVLAVLGEGSSADDLDFPS